MNDYTLKPIELPTLIAVLTKWLPAPARSEISPVTPSRSSRPADTATIVRLMQELLPLLEHHQFDAMGVMRKLKSAAAGTELEPEIAGVSDLLEGFSFDLALQRLRRTMETRNWKESVNNKC